jgi:thioredoxin reductase (NADPH)
LTKPGAVPRHWGVAQAALRLDDLSGALRSRDLFRDLDEESIEWLAHGARTIRLKPNDPLSPAPIRIGGERYYFIVEGQIGVVRGVEYVMNLVEGDFFSDGFLTMEAETPIECVAIMASTAISIEARTLREVMARAPRWARRITERNAELKSHQRTHARRSLRVIQDFYLQQNFSYATTTKVIDLGRCIGCDGCERACADRHGVARLTRKGPALGRLSFAIACRTCVDHRCFHACGFDAISIAKGEEVRIDQSKCVGCAACYSACPNDVITMQETAYTAADFREPMPWTDLDGRTNVPGLFLTGEATGAALIKIAINGGRQAVIVASEELAAQRGRGDALDLVVVGAGPAGLSAALTCLELGLTFEVFDKGDFATTIQTYPREKVVMAEPAHIPLYGKLWLKDTTKEELIGHWREIISSTGLRIRSHEAVEQVLRREDGVFEVTTSRGRYLAKKVVLAVGVRGTPRKLGVAGESEPRVRYQLTEPEELRGRHVLVVGGGDSAVEAAMSLADVPGTQVTLSYRRDSFGRIKQRNKTRLEEYAHSGKLELLLESQVVEIEPEAITLKLKSGDRSIRNDFAFALLGAEPPTKLFEKMGIQIVEPNTPAMSALAASRGNRRYASKCDHCSDYADQACISACPTGAIFELAPKEVFTLGDGGSAREAMRPEAFERGLDRETAKGAALLGSFVAVAIATAVGFECFLRRAIPEWSALAAWQRARGLEVDATFTAGSGLGYALGIAGMTLMALTALYPLHARLGVLRSISKTRLWMSVHVLAGILGPVFVTYHTMLKLDRWPSIAFFAMWLVVLSGAIGRYAFTSLRAAQARTNLEIAFEGVKKERRSRVFERVASSTHVWRKIHVVATIAMFIVAMVHIAAAMLFKVS